LLWQKLASLGLTEPVHPALRPLISDDVISFNRFDIVGGIGMGLRSA
jgi:hypothetical protein